ncbi:putative tyrosine kinase receptor Cad96Ca, partial [Apostichopus japonicus]
MGDMNATCNATGARPAAQISWRHNDREILSSWQRTSSSPGTEDVTTYSTEASLIVQPRENNGTISCIVSGVPAGTKHLVMHYTLTGLEVLNDYSDQRSIEIGIAVAALAVILLCGILVIIFRSGKLKWRPTNEEKTTSLQPTDVDERRHLGFDRKLPQPPVSELPNTAVVNSESSSYQTLPCEEHMYYFTIKTMATHNRVFQAKDMCLIINLTKGLIYDRWMGTISVSKTDKKCVVITAVNESATQRADIHWDLFVKRVLELPHNIHLVKVEGICIEEEKLLLIQEHLSCESLSAFLSDVEQQDYSLTTKYELHLQQRLTFARFILEGLQVLHSYGFLHPGLSTHKVLITDGGNCKLYDFCLSKDAFNTIKAKKLNITCNLNVSAPESYLRKEYDQKSDVWSMAVVIWELIT